MIILGIDPGIADTGFGVVKKECDSYSVIAYGSIKTSSKSNLPERLQRLHRELRVIIKKYRPDIIGVEELFFAKNVKTAITVAHARGVILLTAREQSCEVREFTPLQVKQALVGYGRAEKRQIQQMVKTILGLLEIPKPDDASDALAVAICCGQTRRIDADMRG